MAAEIEQIAQLLNATLDPSQHRKGTSFSFPTPPLPPLCQLINMSLCSRARSQTRSIQAAILSDTAHHCQLRIPAYQHEIGRVARLQKLHSHQLCGMLRAGPAQSQPPMPDRLGPETNRLHRRTRKETIKSPRPKYRLSRSA